MKYDLNGKIVLITGGASGIGYSCVKELLRFGVQAVTIADVNALNGEKAVKELTEEFGPNRVIFVKIDVNKTGQLEAAFKVTFDFWKGLDVVINNAGLMNDNQWELEIALNCKAVVQGTLLGLQYMGKDKGGNGGIIVNIASLLGLQPFGCLPIYSASKHFVVGFSRSIADSYHYNRTDVKILTVCPGVTDTNLISDLDRRPFNFTPDIGEQLYEEVRAAPIQPAKNVGQGVVTAIKKGDNGSIWFSESDKSIYEVQIPHWSTYEVL